MISSPAGSCTNCLALDALRALVSSRGSVDSRAMNCACAGFGTVIGKRSSLAYLKNLPSPGRSTASFNWENVSKRILPQLIYKGQVLRREPLCSKGLFFVCPTPVYKKIEERLGGNLQPIHQQPGSLTMMWYDVGPAVTAGNIRALQLGGSFVRDWNPLATMQMGSFNARYQIAERTVLTAEAAHIERGDTPEGVAAHAGDAQRVALTHDGKALKARVQAARSDVGFDNRSAQINAFPAGDASSADVSGPLAASALYRPSLSPMRTSAALNVAPKSTSALPRNSFNVSGLMAMRPSRSGMR